MSMWSYYQWFGYPFATLLVREWTHCSPWYLQNIVATIMLKNGAHVQREVSHLFPYHTWRWMDIVTTKNSFQTLADVVITDSIHRHLVQHALTTIMHATIVVIQNKTRCYPKRMPWNDFIPLAIKTYDCCHLCFDSGFTTCVHARIARHQQTSLVSSMLIYYYKQQVSIAFQRA
jgi:hypothetical protein